MSKTVQRPATYAQIEALPPDLVGEILYGVLQTHPRPTPRHAMAQGALTSELAAPFQKGRGGPGGWIFMVEPELHLGPHVVVPDIAAWRRECMPVMPDKAFIERAPDWVCEILSPATIAADRGPKRRIYATYGVRYLWHLDPAAKTLETFELREGQWVLVGSFEEGADVTAPPFDAISFAIDDLWPLPESGGTQR